MNLQQFRILYRQFLFRVVDLELLSSHAQGDASKLLGQFAALLVLLGLFCGVGILAGGDTRIPRQQLLASMWVAEHFLISTTMLVVGLFAVLSWDSTFPDRRDVLVLAPLPVRTPTLFFAKIAASAGALGATVAALNGLATPAWGLALAPPTSNPLQLVFSIEPYRTIAAYAITVAAAGGFVFGCVLCVQGLAAQVLPRRLFLRASALLQIAAFSLLVCGYFLQPSASPRMFADPHNPEMLLRFPSFWFLAIFQQLNGTMHPGFEELARRGWLALAVVGVGTALAYAGCYFRTLRRIVEEPDILPGSRTRNWLPQFGDSLQTAVTQFSIRTLLRSRQHRVLLAFYLGIGFALTILLLKTPLAREELTSGTVSGPLVASSIVMICAWIVGMRVVFSMPLDLRANWAFRIMPMRGGAALLSARRRAILALAVVPAVAASCVLFPSLWPWRPAMAHVVFLGLLGVLLAECCLYGTQKLPFTCSYLPGSSGFHLTFWMCVWGLHLIVTQAAVFERAALDDARSYAGLTAWLGLAIACARWCSTAAANAAESQVQFEETVPPVILRLGLARDGS